MQQQFELKEPPPLVVHCKQAKYDVYIGRPSKWGNPFSDAWNSIAEFKVASRQEAIDRFTDWFMSHPDLVAAARTELKGKVLGCWCKPQACHGDILARIANS